jgi:hypothetical protein
MLNINQINIFFSQSSEFFSSIVFILILLIYFMFPLNKYSLNKITNSKNFKNSDAFSINIVIHSFFFLIFSFFNINKEILFFLILLFSIFINLYLFKKILTKQETLICTIFIILVLSYCLKIASIAALQWDGLASWFYKVQIFYQDGSLKDLNNVPYSFYPHLGPYIWAFFWKNSYTEYEYLGRFFYIIIFIISSLTISNRIKNEKIKIIFFACFVLFLTEWTLFGGYQEYFIFSFVTIFSSFFFFFEREFNENKKIFSVLFLFILGILPWIKDEGTIISFFLLFIIIFSKKYKKKYLLIFVLSFIFIMLSSYYLEESLKDKIDWQFKIDFRNLAKYLFDFNFSIKVLINLLFEIAKTWIRYPIWIGILLAGIILNFDKKFKNEKYVTALTVSFPFNILIFFIGYIFLFKDFSFLDGIWHLQTSTFRLILEISGLYAVLLVKFINKNLNKNQKIKK